MSSSIIATQETLAAHVSRTMRSRLCSCLALAILALVPAGASAAPVSEGAEWIEITFPSSNGVKLHADILRPKDLPAGTKTPVILSVGPYFNHSGQVGAAGPVQGATYDPIGPPGPSDRFLDLIAAGIAAAGVVVLAGFAAAVVVGRGEVDGDGAGAGCRVTVAALMHQKGGSTVRMIGHDQGPLSVGAHLCVRPLWS